MKKILSVVVALFMLAGAFSESGLYAKLNAGWSDGSAGFSSHGYSGSVGFKGFDIYGAIGIEPEATSFPDKPFDITFEGYFEAIVGSGDKWGEDWKVFVFNPGVFSYFNWHFENSDSEFLQKFVPYAGAGISLPIEKVNLKVSYPVEWDNYGHVTKKHTDEYDSTEIGFNVNFATGARYAFSEKIEANAEMGWNTLELSTWFLRGGVLFRF